MERKGRAGQGEGGRSCLPGGFQLEWDVLTVGREGGRVPQGVSGCPSVPQSL